MRGTGGGRRRRSALSKKRRRGQQPASARQVARTTWGPEPASGESESGQPQPQREALARQLSPRARTSRSFADYAVEYGYVAEDLRRIVFIGGGLCLAMIGLSLLLG